MAGNHCPKPDGISVGFAATGDPGATFVRHDDGQWSVTVAVPAGTWGPTRLQAVCEVGQTGVPLFAYPQTYQAVIATPYTLDVTATSTGAGGLTLRVMSSKSFCSSIDTVSVGVAPVPDPTFVPDTSSTWPVPITTFAMPQPDAGTVTLDEPWSTTLTIPPSTRPGRYWVVAGCAYARSIPGIFAPSTVTVGEQ